MTRETRINLIFLLILIPLLVPGGIMLFRAKLDPEARRMFKPDFTRRDAVYINYDDHRPDIERIVPPTTSQWVQFETSQLFHPSVRSHIQWHRGLASEAHRFEIVGVTASETSGSILAVVTWDPRIKSPSFLLDDEPLSVVGQFTWGLPPSVRKELQNGGFVLPPDQVTAYLLQASESAYGKQLVLNYITPNAAVMSDQAQLPDQPRDIEPDTHWPSEPAPAVTSESP